MVWVFSSVVLLAFVIWNLSKRKLFPEENQLPGMYTLRDLIRTKFFSFVGEANYVLMDKMAEMFGSVYVHRLWDAKTLIVQDLNLAKEIMASSSWKNRLPENSYLFERSRSKKPLGIMFGNREYWEFSRRFSINALQSTGFHDNHKLESFLATEMQQLFVKLEDACHRKELFVASRFFMFPPLNHLMLHLAGKTLSYDDPGLMEICDINTEWDGKFNAGASLVYFFNFLRFIPGLTEHDLWLSGHKHMRKYFLNIINERKAVRESTGCNDEPGNLIDCFLNKMESDSENGGHFTEENLLIICIDLFLTGGGTTTTALEFAILYMALYPEAQEKVHKEIDHYIGHDSTPELRHKSEMVYTEAATLEILRFATVVPVTGRCPLSAAKVNGVSITPDFHVGINIHGMHNSRKIWADPEDFKPERFLDPSGGSIINTEKIMPFGHGKRKCLGEVQARKIFFLIFTSILQKFTFSFPPNTPAPPVYNPTGLSRHPPPFSVLVKIRDV